MHIRTVEWTVFEIESEDRAAFIGMEIGVYCLFALTLIWRVRATRKLPSGLCLKLTISDKQFECLSFWVDLLRRRTLFARTNCLPGT